MKSFREWAALQESMSVYVKGYDYRSDVNDLDDLARTLKYKLIEPIFEKLDPKTQQEIRNMGSPMHHVISPDGSHYSDGKNVINFYTGGWPQAAIDTIVKGVNYYLKEMGVNKITSKVEKSGMFKGSVVRFEIDGFTKAQNSPPLLNLSNQNAHVIFHDVLGYEDNGSSFSIPVDDLLFKINSLSDDKAAIHAQEPYMQKSPNGATFYHGGLNASGLQDRLEQLRKIALWAKQNHYDQMYAV
jgi:hypothetical protein